MPNPENPPFNPGDDLLYSMDPRGVVYRVQGQLEWREHTIPSLSHWQVYAVATGPQGRGYKVTGRAEHFELAP